MKARRSRRHPTVVLSNDSLAVGLVASNGTGTNLEVWIYDGSTLSRHNITNHTDVNSELQLTTLPTAPSLGEPDHRRHAERA